MRIRSKGVSLGKVDIQLTSMIDVVFQLLAFFLVTFKVAAIERDFGMKLPRTDRGLGESGLPEQITLRLAAAADGDLRQAAIDGETSFAGRDAAAGFRALSADIARRVAAARAAGQEEPEVRIAADDGLRYEFVIDAIAAASTHIDDRGRAGPLARRVSIVRP